MIIPSQGAPAQLSCLFRDGKFNRTLPGYYAEEYLCSTGYITYDNHPCSLGPFNLSVNNVIGDGIVRWEGTGEQYLMLKTHKVNWNNGIDGTDGFGPCESSEWIRWTFGHPARSVGVSACLSLHQSQYMCVEASRGSNVTEPALAWNTSSAKMSTTAIRCQLNVITQDLSIEDHGSLRLDKYVAPTENQQWALGRQRVSPT